MSPAHPPLALLVEEILLRFPPDHPARLACAALVCKSWWRVVTGPVFRRRFRDFHRAPPMLGFFGNLQSVSRFVRTSSTCPQFAVRRNCWVIDARHGRVLLRTGINLLKKPLVVWDPITDHWRKLPFLPGYLLVPRSWNAAVLCAAASLGGATCHHLDCHREPFLVVLVVGTNVVEMVSYVYSSEVGAWIDRRSTQHPGCHVTSVPSALVGNALYFSCWNRNHKGVIKYDLGTKEMSLISLPRSICGPIVLMAMESGDLGFAIMVNSRLYLWRSYNVSPEGDAGWVGRPSIELKSLLPARCDPATLCVIAVADSIGVIFLHADVGILTVDLNSSRVTKVWRKSRCGAIFPFLSFYTPAQVKDSEQVAKLKIIRS